VAASSSSPPPPPNAALGTAVSSDHDLPQGWAWLPKKQEQKPAAAPPVAFQSWSGTNVVLTVSEDDALISVCAPRRAGVLVMVLSVLQKHRLDVVTTQVASDEGRSMFNIHARVSTRARPARSIILLNCSVVCWCLYFDFGKTRFALKFVYCCKSSSPGEHRSNPEAGWRASGVGGHIQACGVGDHSPALHLDAARPLISA
jgi:hypothetical protein